MSDTELLDVYKKIVEEMKQVNLELAKTNRELLDKLMSRDDTNKATKTSGKIINLNPHLKLLKTK